MTDDLISLIDRLRNQGVAVTVTFTVPPREVGAVIPTPAPAKAEATKAEATIKTVLWALNGLKGAPGQPNRDLIRRFLFARGWILPLEEPESWKLEAVPISKLELAALVSQVNQFEQEQKPNAAP